MLLVSIKKYSKNALLKATNKMNKNILFFSTTNLKQKGATNEKDESWGTSTTSQKVMVDFCIIPMGRISVSKEVAECQKIFKKFHPKIETNLHAYGTNISGDWDTVFNAVKECHKVLHNSMNVTRISSTLKIGTRTDKTQTFEDKLQSIEEKLSQ